jgi:ferric-dicitrate binding protein FerR (iron transport regulator)
MPNPDRIAALIVKGYTKPLTTAEQQELDEWAGRSEENRLLVERLNDRQVLTEQLKTYFEVMKEAGKREPVPAARKPVIRMFPKRVAVVLGLLLVGVLAVGGWYWYQHRQQPAVMLTPVMKEMRTHSGQTDSLVLSDDTRVWLNGDSRCYYPEPFMADTREVLLVGEAYFEVPKDSTKPFIVKILSGSDTLQVTVLGTRFNIAADSVRKQVVTTVLQGSVNIKKGADTVLLHSGEQVIANNSGLSAPLKTDTGLTMAWKKNRFECQNVPINQIMNQFKNWYGIEVEYYGSVGDHFFGMFDREKGLPYNLRIIEATGRVTFIVSGNHILVKNL